MTCAAPARPPAARLARAAAAVRRLLASIDGLADAIDDLRGVPAADLVPLFETAADASFCCGDAIAALRFAADTSGGFIDSAVRHYLLAEAAD